MQQTGDILVVDDEQVILDAVKKICIAEGFRVACAAEAHEAQRLLGGGTYLVMLCDIMMPHMDGFQLLEIARRQASLMPVVMMTGFSTVENAVRSLRDGAIDFVPKPFTSDELVTAVRRAVRLRGYREELQKSPAGTGDTTLVVVPCPPKYFRLGYASWVSLQEGGTALIGVTHLFTRVIGSAGSIELQGSNSEVVQGTACAQVRTTDGLSHPVLAPVSGRIVETNEAIAVSASAIEKDPYFSGWLYRVIPSDVDYEVPQLTPCSSGDLY